MNHSQNSVDFEMVVTGPFGPPRPCDLDVLPHVLKEREKLVKAGLLPAIPPDWKPGTLIPQPPGWKPGDPIPPDWPPTAREPKE